MKKPDFVRDILVEEDAELTAFVSQKYGELPLVDFLTFLMSQKDKLNAPSQQALRSKYDQIGEQAIACSPVAQQRYRLIAALLNLVNNVEVDQTLQASRLASDPLLLEMLAFYAEKYLQDASTHDLALRTIDISVRAAIFCGNPLTLSISLYQKGLVLFKLNQMKAAVDCFQTSLDGFQHYYPPAARTLHIYLALCHDSLGQVEEARHHFYALVQDENAPGRETAYRRLGEIEFQLGNLEKARECLQKAESYLASKPKDLAYLQVLQAQVERSLGNLDAAEVMVSKAVDWFERMKDSEGLARALNVQFLLRGSQGRQDEGEASGGDKGARKLAE